MGAASPGSLVTVATLGEGGMGTVYLVRDPARGTLHAMKVVRASDDSLRRRLLSEAGFLTRLKHPNIVTFSGLVELDGDVPALLMEFVEGPSLARLLATQRLTVEQVDALARPMLRGLGAAHEAAVVHRDLKPSNVLLAVQGRELIPKLADFGIAKLLAPEQGPATGTGSLLGTLQYMSPEQLRDARRVDARSDVFSMGALLYEMAAGRPAFGAGGPMDVVTRIDRGEHTPIRALAPGLPARMERAITVALARSPEDRWSDANALLEAWVGDDESKPVDPDWPADVLAGADAFRRHRIESVDGLSTGPRLNTGQPAGAERDLRYRRGRASRVLLIAAAAAAVGLVAWYAVSPRSGASAPQTSAVPGAPTFTRLTFNAVENQVLGAAISPDGKRLLTAEFDGVFLRESLPGTAVALRLPDGSRAAGRVSWCGDDALALSLRRPEEDSPSVWWGEPQAGTWRLVLERADLRGCSWDGRRVLAMRERELVAVELGSGALRSIVRLEGGYIASAAFSPDAAWVAYTWTEGDESTLQVVSADGASPPRVLRRDVLPHGLAWSGDGQLQMLRVRAQETDDRWASLVGQLVESPDQVGAERILAPRIGPAAEGLSVSRAGDRLVYLTIARQRNLFETEVGNLGARQLTADRAPTFAHVWTDDGRLVYSAAPDGSMDIFVRGLDDSPPVRLFSGPVDEYGATLVPGTGEWIFERRVGDEVEVVWSRPAGETVVWTGGAPDYLARRRTRCIPGPSCFLGVVDARGIAVSGITPSGLVPIAHLPAEPWRPIGWDVNAAGDRIASSSSRGLEIRRLDGSVERTLDVEGTLQEVVWARDGTSIWGTAMGTQGHAYALVRIELADGAVEVVRPDTGWISHLALSPSGDRLAWTTTRYEAIAWLAELGP